LSELLLFVCFFPRYVFGFVWKQNKEELKRKLNKEKFVFAERNILKVGNHKKNKNLIFFVCLEISSFIFFVFFLVATCYSIIRFKDKKKVFFFSQVHYQKKIKGRAGDLVGEKRTFLGRQKFLANGVAGGVKIWPDEKKLLVWPGS